MKIMGGGIIISKKRIIKSLMSREEKVLIMNSSICDVNKNLKETLSLFKGRIEKKNLDKLYETKVIDSEIYKLIKTRDAVIEMKNKSSYEWRPVKYIGKKNTPCELCGSKKSEEKFIIKNMKNDNELKVGSSCIHKFDKMNNILYGISTNQVVHYTKINPKKLKRIVQFNENYPGGKSLFANWQNEYNNFDIVFPKNYDDEFNDLLKEGKKIYRAYINFKINNAQVKKFKFYIDNYKYLYDKCQKFYNENKDDRYICNKKIARLLENEGYEITLAYIRLKNGKITQDIAKNIYYIEFVKRFKNDIENLFKKYNIKLQDLNDQYIYFSYKYNNFEPIYFKNSLKKFTFEFSDAFYNINNFSKHDIFKGLTIKNSFYNISNFIEILDYILKQSGYYLFIDEKLYEKQQIELDLRGFNKFAILRLNDILNNFNEVLYLDEMKSEIILLDYIKSIHKWINKSDKDKYDIGKINQVWTKGAFK